MNKEESNLAEYLSQLLDKNMREDGRKPYQFRKLKIVTDVLSQANGSARVKLGDTEILVGVKMDIGEPFPDSPEEGILIVTGELTPIAADEYETGPPTPEAIEIARVIDRAIRESGAIDMAKLCIKPKERVWIIFIDIYPINNDGNLFDAGLLGAIAALKTAKMPKYDKKEDKVNYRELTNQKLPVVELPVLCTFGKIDDKLFVDPTAREEKVMDCRLSIGVIENRTICAMQKGGEGSITRNEVLDIVKRAQELSKELRKIVKLSVG